MSRCRPSSTTNDQRHARACTMPPFPARTADARIRVAESHCRDACGRHRVIACRRTRSPRLGCRDDRLRDGAIVQRRRAWLLLLGETSYPMSARPGRSLSSGLEGWRASAAFVATPSRRLLEPGSSLPSKRSAPSTSASAAPREAELRAPAKNLIIMRSGAVFAVANGSQIRCGGAC